MATINDVEAAGWAVEVASEPTPVRDATVYSVTAPGVIVYVASDDAATLAAFASNPAPTSDVQTH